MRIFSKERILSTGGIYLLATQPSFAQAAGHALTFRGFILFLVAIAAAYWCLGYYFKQRRRNEGSGSGFRLPPAAWFVIAAITAAIGNVLVMVLVFSLNPANDILAGFVAIFYFLFGWTLPGTVVAIAQMMQTPAPESLLEAHNNG